MFLNQEIKQMNNIHQLITENVNGSTFISIDTETDVKLKGGKKNLCQGRVTKRTTKSNVMVFQNKSTNGYENMVKRRLSNEGKDSSTFELQPRKWGTRIVNTPFVEHKGQYYLEVIFLKSGNVEVLLDDEVTDKSNIEGYPSSKVESVQGGLDNKVVIRTFKIDSITSITINHQQYSDLTFEC